MASARRKQDEKNLKTLRELVSVPHNKHCFDCNQRGPTYVNVTIGSFVCTKCSGMLRGLTPPHRVKSISMATFTPEEIELLRTRGNDYCQRVWLGLFDGTKPSDRDEQAVHTLMLDKYEKKRYYMDPSVALRNGYNKQQTDAPKPQEATVKPLTSIIAEPRPLRLNGDKHAAKNDFVADFAHADIFNAANNNVVNPPVSNNTQPSFANFDNNPVFNNSSMPLTSSNMTAMNGTITYQQSHQVSQGPPAPPEDRYAALKDLDNAFKSQPMFDWNSGGSTSSPYSSPTTAGSIYSSTASPQSSSYGSPSQGQFMNQFLSQESTNNISNPFNTNGGGIWGNSNGNQNGVNGINPFYGTTETYMNGGSSFPTMFSQPINGTTFTPNPFKVANGHSNNPFL